MLNLRFLSLALRSPRKLNNVTTSVNKYHSSFDSAPVITSLFDPQSDLYKENYSQMKNLVNILNSKTNYVLQGGKGSEKVRERHTSKGKLLARDRIKVY